MKIGKAKLEIKLGNSSFNFSLENPSPTPAGNASQVRKKKKSPSNLKRDALRKEKFLAAKRMSSLPENPSSDPPSKSPVESCGQSTASVIMESQHNTKDCEAMDTASMIESPFNQMNDFSSDDENDEDNQIQFLFCVPDESTAKK